ncbi:uncharacterized protein Nost [Venturia canescens]|uniref:uncharacterized protein Nost n=1 Tax=Venturia canescens TaxID=32260 RepID=UPI001C9C544F|nr:uncharacterized protein LOC122419021 [Venturia canescens]XP_043289186.1 uncharacterized protein LOC122419021 [Venturia canescens]
MKEVKQAWTALLSSKNLVTSGTSAPGASDTSIPGNNNSRATWYDAPVPVIIHGRTFDQEGGDNSNAMSRTSDERSPGNGGNSIKGYKGSMPKRRLSKDSGIETIASLRRTFLDEFRKSNVAEELGNEAKVEGQREKECVSRNGRLSRCTLVVSDPSDGTLNGNSNFENNHFTKQDSHEEVLYENNVEAALNSLSKICTKELDINAESSTLRNPVDLDDSIEGEDEKRSEDESNGSIAGRRRRRKSSSGSRRHSSSVELTAKATVKTDNEGVPTISFSFLRSEDNAKPFIRDIPLEGEDEVEMSLEVSEPLVRQDLYDFPKRESNKRPAQCDEEAAENKAEEKEPTAELPPRRLVNIGENGVAPRSTEIELYDFPKNGRPNLPAKSPKISKSDITLKQQTPMKSVRSRCAEDIDKLEDRLYESPIDAKDLSCSVSKSSEIINAPFEEETGTKKLSTEELHRPRDQRKIAYRSLRAGRSVGRIEILDTERAKDIQAYYSDPECQESSGAIDELDNVEGLKNRKRHRRLGKAWGKMRTWLREEKSRLGEVVTRHAKMQAVGVHHRSGKSESALSMGSRTGSYDLTEARTRQLGEVTRVEEFGLSSVSEEGNASDSERPEWSTDELHADDDDGCALEVDNNDARDEEDKENHRKRNQLAHSPNDYPDGDLASGRLGKTLRADNAHRGMPMKLTPVSFSVDKLCPDEVNDDPTNGIPLRRDSEHTTTSTTTTATRDHVGKGGLIKRRMLGSIRGLMASTHLLHQQQNETEEGGPGGFEEVRRYVKQGGDFCKELAAILHERAELEASYSKGLSKLSGKLTKACAKDQGGNTSGGVTEAWRSIGEEMEAAAEAHRVWGAALGEQLAKPLRVGVAEAQGRSRKAIESSVDKASKSLQEWRGIAAKSKKQSFSCARENERLQDLARIQSISQSQQNNNKISSHQMTEKEVNKLETRRRKAEDSSRRADTEFYTVSVRAERARLEYESTVRKGAKQMELLEEERLSALKDLANVYLAHLQALAPRLQQSADRLSSPVRSCNVSQDVDILKNVIRRLESNDGSNVDQLLPDFYAEHVTLAMNRERRKQSLVRVLHLIRQDLERERRGREGLETLHRAFIQTPAFAADESTQNVTEKLHHMRSMLTFLEAARYKVGGTLAEIEGGKRGKHPLAEHILVSRDKQGLQQSVLKVPSWAKNESFEFPESQDELELHLTKDHDAERQDWVDRTAGDGNSENPPDEEDFSDFDEFSSQSEDNNNQEVEIADMTDKTDITEQCRAIYQYSANLNDELSLTPGDLITIHEKQADGWWIGECAGRTGIFPATYVQLIR